MNVAMRKISLRGDARWQLDYLRDGKRHRPVFPSKEAAEHERGRLVNGAVSAKGVWAALPKREREAVVMAYWRARERGHSLFELLERSGEVRPESGPVLTTAIEELCQAKRNAGRADRYVANLKIVLNQFANGQQYRRVSALSVTGVERFLDGKNIRYRQTLRGRLSTLFNFCVRRGYRADNPCDRLESVKAVQDPVSAFTVEQVETAVDWLKKHQPAALPWFGLSTFCGLRPEEAAQTRKADIHFEEGFIKVEAQTSKVRQRRVVYPRPEAMAFVKWALRHGKLPLGGGRRRRILSGHKTKRKGLRGALGWEMWPKDITRHTAASYWLACEGETVARVAKMLGHSERTCESRYKAVKTQKEAAEFWKVVKQLAML